MHSARRIIAQTGMQIFGKLLGIVLGVFAIAIITRSLGREGFGWYATVMAYLQVVGIAVDLGLNVLAPQVLAETRALADRETEQPSNRNTSERALLSNILTMRLTAGVILFGLAAAVAFFIPAYSPAIRIGIAIATFSFLSIVLVQILQVPFQVEARMGWPTFAELLGRFVVLGGVALAWWWDGGLIGMVLATTIANIIAVTIMLWATYRILPYRLSFDFPVWRSILARSWPVGLSILFNLVYLRADVVILSLLKPADHVGLYAAPYRLLDILTQVPHLVMGLVLPMLAASWAARNHVQFRDRLQHVFDGLAFLGAPLVAGAIVLGTPVMELVAGRQFAASGPILGILAFALLGIFLGQPFGYAIVAVGKQRTMLWGYAVVAVVTLAGYLLLIPRYSYWGAAWMSVVSEVAVAAITFVLVRRATGIRLRFGIPLSALAASLVMAGGVLLTPALPVLVRVSGGSIVYALCAYALPPTRRLVLIALDRPQA